MEKKQKPKKRSIWEVIKNCVNGMPVGNLLYRQDFFDRLKEQGFFIANGYDILDPVKYHTVVSSNSVDQIRNLLTGTGFLELYGKRRGAYLVKKHIPEEMTQSQLRKMYDEHWK